MVAPKPVRKIYWTVQISVLVLLAVFVVGAGIAGGGGPAGYVLAALCVGVAVFLIIMWRGGKL
jgi:hypothetical protein